MMMMTLKIMIILLASAMYECQKNNSHFPDGFKFGIATAAYQIEGAWNKSDKGESVWDHFVHTQSHKIKDGSNGDVACDSYHNYKRDVQMLVELGVDFYRFSLSWPRLLPTGFDSYISQDGLNYYNNLIDELLKYNITPVITLFHWDTPQVFQDVGGWTNPFIIDYFADYARVAFEKFGDRVKEWITFNEAFNLCWLGYGANVTFFKMAPDINFHGVGEYECIHNVLKAHAKAYHIYKDNFKNTQKGKVSIATIFMWVETESNSTQDAEIANKAIQFNVGWSCHPIFSKEGDYPKVMREEIDKLSKMQGFHKSRLPTFTPEEVAYIRGTYDYFGMNYYTALIFKNGTERPDAAVPSFHNDLGHKFYQPEEWVTGASSWLKLRPDGMRESLKWIAKEYGNVEIFITENGYSSFGGLNDVDRVDFLNTHLGAVLEAINDNVNVKAYTAWSLMDNFEWGNGYTERFGLYEVDFSSPNKTRTPRMSALVYSEIIKTKTLNYTYYPRIESLPTDEKDVTYPYLLILLCVVILIITAIILIRRFINVRNEKRRQEANSNEIQLNSPLTTVP